MNLLKFQNLSSLGTLVHGVTTAGWLDDRFSGPFNLADHTGQNKDQAPKARRLLAQHLGLDIAKLTMPRQVHANRITIIDDQQVGRAWTDRQSSLAGADGLATRLTAVPLMVLSADCPLIIAYDPLSSVLGLAHGGWRSTLGAISTNLVETMRQELDAQPDRIIAGIGPAAGKCCYQIGSEVVDQFKQADLAQQCCHQREGRFYLDLQQANYLQLLKSGLRAGNIETMDICTICDDRFFSYRRQGAASGRFGLIAAMVDR